MIGAPVEQTLPALHREHGQTFGRRAVFALLWVVLVAGSAALAAAPRTLPAVLNVEVGAPAPQDVLAPRSVSFESASLTEQARDRAAAAVADVYDPPNSRIARQQILLLRDVIGQIDDLRADTRISLADKQAQLTALPDLPLTDAAASLILRFSEDAWITTQNEALAARDLGVRVVCLRIGIVLAKKGGALDAMLPLFRKGLGGPLGSGQQWMPWVHARDVVRVILFAANESSISGPINVCAPNPVRNEDFTQALGRALHRPAFLRAPEFGIRLMLGEFADAVLSSQRAVPNALLAAGYTFSFEELARALKDATAPSEEAAPTGGT